MSERTPEAVDHGAAIAARITSALVWYFDTIYDGTEVEEWVEEARETLGDYLCPDGDARTKSEAVEALIAEASK